MAAARPPGRDRVEPRVVPVVTPSPIPSPVAPPSVQRWSLAPPAARLERWAATSGRPPIETFGSRPSRTRLSGHHARTRSRWRPDPVSMSEPGMSRADPPAPDADDDLLRFGRFRLVQPLGKGGMGTVFLAEDLELGRRVALKLLAAHRLLSESARARFLREARLMAGLDHPHIVRVLDAGETEHQPYLVMEAVDGVSLATLLPALRAPLATLRGRDVAAAVAQLLGDGDHDGTAAARSGHWPDDYVRLVAGWGLQIAHALACAHAAGVVHRDVKPSNIMLRRNGQVALTDFGLARAADEVGLTRTGDFAGTAHYAAPEQHTGAGAADHRADVFSLGATLYELLTHRRAFDGESALDVKIKIDRVDPPPALELNRRVPRDLAAVVQRALEKGLGRRYQTAAALADDLHRWLDGRPVVARPISRLARIVRSARRNPLATAFFASTITATLLAWQAIRSQAALERAIRESAAGRVQRQVDSLRRRARALLPIGPAVVPPLQGLIADAEALWERNSEFAEQLATLRRRGRFVAGDDGDEDARLDREQLPLQREMEWIAGCQRQLASDSPGTATAREAARLADRSARLKALIEGYRRYRFDSDFERSLHDNFEDGMLTLALFASDEMAELRHRLALARATARPAPPSTPSWPEVLADLRQDSVFRRVALAAAPDLVPLGRDPESHLHEFAHVGSGELARRAPQGGITIGPTTGLVFVLLPPGAVPRAHGAVDAFYCSKYEVSVGQMRQLAQDLDARADGAPRWWLPPRLDGRLPAHLISWNDAVEVVHRWDLALPTELQWEYACRGGALTDWNTGDDPSRLRGVANFKWPGTKSNFWFVDYRTPNGYGLFQTHGNVAEWLGLADEPASPVGTSQQDGLRSVGGGHLNQEPDTTTQCGRFLHLAPSLASIAIGVRPVRHL
ncbi:MAG: protein kinase [Planctomycetota bacterium]